MKPPTILESENDMSVTLGRVRIPEDVIDNSEKVTDYAFMRHRSPGRGAIDAHYRDNTIAWRNAFKYSWFTWTDENPSGQRCRFDMLVRADGTVAYLFHTEYFTRVPCAKCEYHYAVRYVKQISDDWETDPAPLCEDDLTRLERVARHDNANGHNIRLAMSERLLVGQH